MRQLAVLIRRLALLAALAVAGGFVVFVFVVSRSAEPPPRADAIVALTGGGGARIEAGMALLEAGLGARLLISGVHPDTPDGDVLDLANAQDPAMFTCCVDLDRRATTTFENGEETARWARENGYGSLIVVTSDFHMPRAIRVISRAADHELTLYPYSVSRPDGAAGGWSERVRNLRRLSVEYVKYLVILAKDALSGGPARDEAAAEP